MYHPPEWLRLQKPLDVTDQQSGSVRAETSSPVNNSLLLESPADTPRPSVTNSDFCAGGRMRRAKTRESMTKRFLPTREAGGTCWRSATPHLTEVGWVQAWGGRTKEDAPARGREGQRVRRGLRNAGEQGGAACRCVVHEHSVTKIH
jgi:hypothetical protein